MKNKPCSCQMHSKPKKAKLPRRSKKTGRFIKSKSK